MNLTPLSISLRNFQSFGNNLVTINLKFNNCTLIQGRNLDAIIDGQVDSNGAGKSTIRAAIVYACYGETLNSKLKVGDLINRINKKNMQVIFDFEKNGKYYRIDRYKKLEKNGKRYGGDGVYLLEKNTFEEKWNYDPKKDGGHDITPASGEVTKEIRNKLGIPFEIFTRILTIAATATPFLSLEVGKQRELLEELFSYNELSEKADVIKDTIKTNKAELETFIKLDEQIKSEIDRYNSQLTLTTNKVNEWNATHTRRKNELEQKIKEYNETIGIVNFDAEESKLLTIDTLTQEINELENSATLLSRDLQAAKNLLHKITQWDTDHEKELDALSEKITQPLIFQTLDDAQECQAIKQAYVQSITTHNTSISELDAKIIKQKNIIATSKKEIITRQENIKRFNNEIATLDSEVNQLTDSKCPYCSQHYANAKDKIADKMDHKIELGKFIAREEAIIKIENEKIKTANDALTTIENERQLIINKKQSETESHNNLMQAKYDGLNAADFNKEYQKTVNRQKLIDEFKVKDAQTNPFLADISLDDLNTKQVELSEQFELLTRKINTKKTEKKMLTNTLMFKSIKEITSAKIMGETVAKDLDKLEQEVNPHVESLIALEATPPSKRKTDEIEELHTFIEHQEFLVKLLTKKESFLRKALLLRYTPFLNERLKYYLDKMGLPYRVTFKEDMTAAVSQFKTEVNPASLSLGQQARVNIAFPFAFRDVLQKRYGVIPFCMLDEFLDTGLGNVGVQLAAKMVKEIARENGLSMFVISHKDEISNMFDSKMMIELKNGFSSVIT